MVDITKIKKKEKTKLCACRIPEKYHKKLNENDISFTGFVIQALKETFD